MPKVKLLTEKKSTATADSGMDKPLPSVEDFREAVKYALTHDHGMPPLYADEVLDGDPEFLERHRQTYHKVMGDVGAVARAADGLRFDPPQGLKWVALEQGQRVADQDQIVLDADGAIGKYLDSLVALGLHGGDRNAVAAVMLAKGIETVFPLILTNLKK